MIALLTGKLAHKSPEFIILDVNGVGYRVQIPFSTYYELPEETSTTTLHIFTHVKEDAINLYGFRTLAEKSMFQHLISVSGIGPKLGSNILSNIDVKELAAAITGGDLGRLGSIPGIGKKTAERLVLELKEKLRSMQHTEDAAPRAAAALPDVAEDVTSALLNLGYKEAQVKKALAELTLQPGDTVETALKQALKLLMR
ncbi:Holliday junction branch migration protein RuvA [Geobacter sp. DSM 9736]|uniref:Holliday junction branch migration protein RuvA n=1 Tax=Geobacter sp. DSM 9736 TaxID=1277350 RepID=UPI000B512DF1|nr:Holliday junction branch migration protein RuvA [Geobacter sp. DSM 9736]SNB46326.1 Holliday junction DNA helicase subunit RuvA [Geobacter sp. DSM 9736]